MPVTAWTPIWLAQADLENGLSVATIAACFDDGSGVLNTTAILACIADAELEVMSYLGDYGPPPFTTQQLAVLGGDPFLAACALDFAKYFVFDRHPEYVRSNGKDQQDRWDRATAKMTRVLDSRQRPPVVPVTPSNVGGATVDGGPRIYVPGPNGQYNGGDYLVAETDPFAELRRMRGRVRQT